jgi:hypothetical protein
MSMNRDEVAIYIGYIINKYLERESGEKRKQLLMKLEQWYNTAVKKFTAGLNSNLPNERQLCPAFSVWYMLWLCLKFILLEFEYIISYEPSYLFS